MRVEFNGYSYNIENKMGQVACAGCIMDGGRNLKCPVNSEGECILSFDKIYTDCYSNQVFKV